MNSSWKGLLKESEVSSSTRYLTTGSPPSESGCESPYSTSTETPVGLPGRCLGGASEVG